MSIDEMVMLKRKQKEMISEVEYLKAKIQLTQSSKGWTATSST